MYVVGWHATKTTNTPLIENMYLKIILKIYFMVYIIYFIVSM